MTVTGGNINLSCPPRGCEHGIHHPCGSDGRSRAPRALQYSSEVLELGREIFFFFSFQKHDDSIFALLCLLLFLQFGSNTMTAFGCKRAFAIIKVWCLIFDASHSGSVGLCMNK